jgi:hypothetical protein
MFFHRLPSRVRTLHVACFSGRFNTEIILEETGDLATPEVLLYVVDVNKLTV